MQKCCAALAVLFLCACPSGKPPPDGGTPTPIRYVVVILKENHTFDNYFTGFPGAETTPTALLSDGGTLVRPHAPNGPTARDVSHSRDNALVGYDDGKMDGFDLMYEAKPTDGGPPDYQPFIYYSEDQIPNYWAYARQFALFDHFFSNTFGPSTPGHTALVSAQSPVYSNTYCIGSPATCGGGGSGCFSPSGTVASQYDPLHCTYVGDVYPCFDLPTVPAILPEGFTWATYSPGSGTGSDFNIASAVLDGGIPTDHFKSMNNLLADLDAQDALPNFLYLKLTGDLNKVDISEHPPADVCPGEGYTVDVINKLMQGPHWKEMAIVVTWDDWGGFFDHVPPPVNKCDNGQFYGPGFRLPLLIISPYAKQGVVVHDVVEQASVPKLIEELWGLASLKSQRQYNLARYSRDEVAGSLMGAFDFSQAPRDPVILTKKSCP